MFVSRVFSRLSRSVCQSYRFLAASQLPPHLHSCGLQSHDNLIPVPISSLYLTINSSSSPRALCFSSTSPKPDVKEHENNDTITSAVTTEASEEEAKASGETESSGQADGSGNEVFLSRDEKEYVENFATGLLDAADNLRRTAFIGKDMFSKIDASKGINGIAPLLKKIHDCLEGAKKQFAEVFKKFGVGEFDSKHEPCGPDRDGAIIKLQASSQPIQNFTKSLVDVADNLGKASSVAKDKFSNVDAFKESDEAVPLLRTLLEAVEITEKQLNEVFKKFGFEKFDSKHELFNPERHDAILQFQVSSQPPGTIIAVLKAGYIFDDRIIRRAEVAITRAVEESLEDAETQAVEEGQDSASDKEESESRG